MTGLPLTPGSRFGPHYVIEAPIGEGGMGVVYRARDTRLGRSVALKVLASARIGNPDGLRRFEQEARAASSLNHPNIVTIHEIGKIGDVSFIAQEFVAGETLRHRLATRLARRFPKSTVSREVAIPQIRGAAALSRNRPDVALEALRAFRTVGSCAGGLCVDNAFRGYYLRGAAYLRQQKGADAAAVFQTILDHPGWAPASPLYPMAYLGLARAFSMNGDTARARKAYEDLFEVWKHADADLPVLVEARREYAAVMLQRPGGGRP